MYSRALSLPRRLGLSWLMWLALLLPVSQSLAAWHQLSHRGQAGAAHAGDDGTLHKTSCGLCLAAASVDHGGLPAAYARVSVPALLAASPALPRIESPARPLVRRYLSRAPPAFLR